MRYRRPFRFLRTIRHTPHTAARRVNIGRLCFSTHSLQTDAVYAPISHVESNNVCGHTLRDQDDKCNETSANNTLRLPPPKSDEIADERLLASVKKRHL